MRIGTQMLWRIGFGIALGGLFLTFLLALKSGDQVPVDQLHGQYLGRFLALDTPASHSLLKVLSVPLPPEHFLILHVPARDLQLQEMDRKVLGCLKEKLPAKVVGCRDPLQELPHHLMQIYDRQVLIPLPELMVQLAAFDLPETLVLNPKGILVFRWRGPLAPVFCESEDFLSSPDFQAPEAPLPMSE